MADSLLDAVCAAYLESGDFNGLLLYGADATIKQQAMEAVRADMVQVVTQEDYPNPSIRPWPSMRSTDEQVASIDALDGTGCGVCLYPTPAALADRARDLHADQPYRQQMAEGRGALELAYFEFAVLEPYRDDPRFTFRFNDFGAQTIISDAVYLDEGEPEHDKIIMRHIGFAYDLSRYNADDPDSPIVRRVCAFYGDLAKLSPRHQQRWQTYQIDDETPLEPHPVWWGEQMGHWADGLGPFDRLSYELEALSTVYEKIFSAPLLVVTERPEDFGWLLRPTQHDWDAFVVQMDKLLSENLRHDALTAAGVPRSDDSGQPMGTLQRLERLMLDKRVPANQAAEVLQPFREVRRARQLPAHTLRTNVTDATFIHKQVELMERVTASVEQIRRFFQTHPACKDWTEPDLLHVDATCYRM
jgi:hypothetical protein